MKNWIVDTNIISEQNKRKPNPHVLDWLNQTLITTLFTTTVSVAEIRYGIIAQSDIARANILETWLEQTVRPSFSNRVLGVDENVLLQWRLISRKLQQARQPTPPTDLLIAAIAIENACGVATRDVAPFVACGIPTLNPFTGERFNGA